MKSFHNINLSIFFENMGTTLSLQKVFLRYEKANEMCPTIGKPTYLTFTAFANSSPNSSTMLIFLSSTMATLMDSRSMLCSTRLNSGTLRHLASSTSMMPSIFMPSKNSWLMNFTQDLLPELSIYSSPDLSTLMTSGPSFTPSLAALTRHHM